MPDTAEPFTKLYQDLQSGVEDGRIRPNLTNLKSLEEMTVTEAQADTVRSLMSAGKLIFDQEMRGDVEQSVLTNSRFLVETFFSPDPQDRTEWGPLYDEVLAAKREVLDVLDEREMRHQRVESENFPWSEEAHRLKVERCMTSLKSIIRQIHGEDSVVLAPEFQQQASKTQSLADIMDSMSLLVGGEGTKRARTEGGSASTSTADDASAKRPSKKVQGSPENDLDLAILNASSAFKSDVDNEEKTNRIILKGELPKFTSFLPEWTRELGQEAGRANCRTALRETVKMIKKIRKARTATYDRSKAADPDYESEFNLAMGYLSVCGDIVQSFLIFLDQLGSTLSQGLGVGTLVKVFLGDLGHLINSVTFLEYTKTLSAQRMKNAFSSAEDINLLTLCEYLIIDVYTYIRYPPENSSIDHDIVDKMRGYSDSSLGAHVTSQMLAVTEELKKATKISTNSIRDRPLQLGLEKCDLNCAEFMDYIASTTRKELKDLTAMIYPNRVLCNFSLVSADEYSKSFEDRFKALDNPLYSESVRDLPFRVALMTNQYMTLSSAKNSGIVANKVPVPMSVDEEGDEAEEDEMSRKKTKYADIAPIIIRPGASANSMGVLTNELLMKMKLEEMQEITNKRLQKDMKNRIREIMRVEMILLKYGGYEYNEVMSEKMLVKFRLSVDSAYQHYQDCFRLAQETFGYYKQMHALKNEKIATPVAETLSMKKKREEKESVWLTSLRDTHEKAQKSTTQLMLSVMLYDNLHNQMFEDEDEGFGIDHVAVENPWLKFMGLTKTEEGLEETSAPFFEYVFEGRITELNFRKSDNTFAIMKDGIVRYAAKAIRTDQGIAATVAGLVLLAMGAHAAGVYIATKSAERLDIERGKVLLAEAQNDYLSNLANTKPGTCLITLEINDLTPGTGAPGTSSAPITENLLISKFQEAMGRQATTDAGLIEKIKSISGPKSVTYLGTDFKQVQQGGKGYLITDGGTVIPQKFMEDLANSKGDAFCIKEGQDYKHLKISNETTENMVKCVFGPRNTFVANCAAYTKTMTSNLYAGGTYRLGVDKTVDIKSVSEPMRELGKCYQGIVDTGSSAIKSNLRENGLLGMSQINSIENLGSGADTIKAMGHYRDCIQAVNKLHKALGPFIGTGYVIDKNAAPDAVSLEISRFAEDASAMFGPTFSKMMFGTSEAIPKVSPDFMVAIGNAGMSAVESGYRILGEHATFINNALYSQRDHDRAPTKANKITHLADATVSTGTTKNSTVIYRAINTEKGWLLMDIEGNIMPNMHKGYVEPVINEDSIDAFVNLVKMNFPGSAEHVNDNVYNFEAPAVAITTRAGRASIYVISTTRDMNAPVQHHLSALNLNPASRARFAYTTSKVPLSKEVQNAIDTVIAVPKYSGTETKFPPSTNTGKLVGAVEKVYGPAAQSDQPIELKGAYQKLYEEAKKISSREAFIENNNAQMCTTVEAISEKALGVCNKLLTTYVNDNFSTGALTTEKMSFADESAAKLTGLFNNLKGKMTECVAASTNYDSTPSDVPISGSKLKVPLSQVNFDKCMKDLGDIKGQIFKEFSSIVGNTGISESDLKGCSDVIDGSLLNQVTVGLGVNRDGLLENFAALREVYLDQVETVKNNKDVVKAFQKTWLNEFKPEVSSPGARNPTLLVGGMGNSGRKRIISSTSNYKTTKRSVGAPSATSYSLLDVTRRSLGEAEDKTSPTFMQGVSNMGKLAGRALIIGLLMSSVFVHKTSAQMHDEYIEFPDDPADGIATPVPDDTVIVTPISVNPEIVIPVPVILQVDPTVIAFTNTTKGDVTFNNATVHEEGTAFEDFKVHNITVTEGAENKTATQGTETGEDDAFVVYIRGKNATEPTGEQKIPPKNVVCSEEYKNYSVGYSASYDKYTFNTVLESYITTPKPFEAFKGSNTEGCTESNAAFTVYSRVSEFYSRVNNLFKDLKDKKLDQFIPFVAKDLYAKSITIPVMAEATFFTPVTNILFPPVTVNDLEADSRKATTLIVTMLKTVDLKSLKLNAKNFTLSFTNKHTKQASDWLTLPEAIAWNENENYVYSVRGRPGIMSRAGSASMGLVSTAIMSGRIFAAVAPHHQHVLTFKNKFGMSPQATVLGNMDLLSLYSMGLLGTNYILGGGASDILVDYQVAQYAIAGILAALTKGLVAAAALKSRGTRTGGSYGGVAYDMLIDVIKVATLLVAPTAAMEWLGYANLADHVYAALKTKWLITTSSNVVAGVTSAGFTFSFLPTYNLQPKGSKRTHYLGAIATGVRKLPRSIPRGTSQNKETVYTAGWRDFSDHDMVVFFTQEHFFVSSAEYTKLMVTRVARVNTLPPGAAAPAPVPVPAAIPAPAPAAAAPVVPAVPAAPVAISPILTFNEALFPFIPHEIGRGDTPSARIIAGPEKWGLTPLLYNQEFMPIRFIDSTGHLYETSFFEMLKMRDPTAANPLGVSEATANTYLWGHKFNPDSLISASKRAPGGTILRSLTDVTAAGEGSLALLKYLAPGIYNTHSNDTEQQAHLRRTALNVVSSVDTGSIFGILAPLAGTSFPITPAGFNHALQMFMANTVVAPSPTSVLDTKSSPLFKWMTNAASSINTQFAEDVDFNTTDVVVELPTSTTTPSWSITVAKRVINAFCVLPKRSDVDIYERLGYNDSSASSIGLPSYSATVTSTTGTVYQAIGPTLHNELKQLGLNTTFPDSLGEMYNYFKALLDLIDKLLVICHYTLTTYTTAFTQDVNKNTVSSLTFIARTQTDLEWSRAVVSLVLHFISIMEKLEQEALRLTKISCENVRGTINITATPRSVQKVFEDVYKSHFVAPMTAHPTESHAVIPKLKSIIDTSSNMIYVHNLRNEKDLERPQAIQTENGLIESYRLSSNVVQIEQNEYLASLMIKFICLCRIARQHDLIQTLPLLILDNQSKLFTPFGTPLSFQDDQLVSFLSDGVLM